MINNINEILNDSVGILSQNDSIKYASGLFAYLNFEGRQYALLVIDIESIAERAERLSSTGKSHLVQFTQPHSNIYLNGQKFGMTVNGFLTIPKDER